MTRSPTFIAILLFGLIGLGGLHAQGSSAAPDPTADPVEGIWINGDGDGYIEVRRSGDTLHGTILGGPDGGNRLDEKNPNPELRSRRLTGLRIMDGLKAEGPSQWGGGQIYDPNSGKTYRCSVELENENTLKVRGYIGVSLFGRTDRWTRKKD